MHSDASLSTYIFCFLSLIMTAVIVVTLHSSHSRLSLGSLVWYSNLSSLRFLSTYCNLSFYPALLLFPLLLSLRPVKLHLQSSPNQMCTSGGQFVSAPCGLKIARLRRREARCKPSIILLTPRYKKKMLRTAVCFFAHLSEYCFLFVFTCAWLPLWRIFICILYVLCIETWPRRDWD